VVPINIASVNVCGISRKYAPIKNFIDSDKIQILAMSETRSPRPIKIKKFVTYQRDSNPNPKIRGVALLVSDALASVSHDLPPNLTHLEAIAAKITINNLAILIISYYNPPSEKVSAELLFYLTQFDHAIILGEFNARHTDFGDTMTNANGRILVRSLAAMPLCRLHNTSPTLLSHKGCSIIDHIIITERFSPYINTSSHIGTTVTSDHLPLVTNLTNAGPPERPNFIPIDDFNQTDWQAYQRQISEHLPEIIQTTEPNAIDAQVTRFAETVIRAKEITVPRKYIPTNKRPIPRTILDKIHEKRKVYRRFILTRDPFLKTIFNKLNAQIRRDLNRYREDQWIDTCRSLDYRDGKSFWSRFQQITGQKKHSNHHLIHQKQTLSTPQDKANCFAQTLQEIHQVPDDPHFDNRFFNKITQNVTNFFNIAPNPPDRLPLEDQSLTEQIHTEEIAAHIKYLKNRKAPGPDSIKPILLKKLPRDAIEKLTTIYNNCIQACYFPTAWKTSQNNNDPKTRKRPFRSSFISTNLPAQYPRENPRKSFVSPTKVVPQIKQPPPTPTICFPSTALNHQPHPRTPHRLHPPCQPERMHARSLLRHRARFRQGMARRPPPKIHLTPNKPMFTRMIKSVLENRTCSVQANHQNSAPIHIHAGVPQGFVLSPILYLVYCSDFPVSDTSRTKTRMFADDTTLWTCSKNPEFAQRSSKGNFRVLSAGPTLGE
jgi:exonuclease III